MSPAGVLEMQRLVGNARVTEALVQRAAGDGHDLTNPRFSGDPDLEAAFDGERFVRFGSRGEGVRKVQQALIDMGIPLPQFGADGIFGQETATAVRRFQTEQGLSPDAIIGPLTMGALDRTAPGSGGGGGLPTFPPVVPPIAPPVAPPVKPPTPPVTITTKVDMESPGKAPADRTTIGSGEDVDLTASGFSRWTATAGSLKKTVGNKVRWRAPLSGSVTVTATTFSGSTASVSFTVVPPDRLAMRKLSDRPFPAGEAGVGMDTELLLGHPEVSFFNLEWRELDGPAITTGYFAERAKVQPLDHDANDTFAGIFSDNTFMPDVCTTDETPQDPGQVFPGPYSVGTLTWEIPNELRVRGTTTTMRLDSKQVFGVNELGDMSVSKQGAFAFRTPSGLSLITTFDEPAADRRPT